MKFKKPKDKFKAMIGSYEGRYSFEGLIGESGNNYIWKVKNNVLNLSERVDDFYRFID